MKLKELAKSFEEKEKLEKAKLSMGRTIPTDNNEILDVINSIYLPDIVMKYKPCLELASDGKNFIGCGNNEYKGFFYEKKDNIIVWNGTHHISDKYAWYNPFVFVREHFCSWDNHKTYERFKTEYPWELKNFMGIPLKKTNNISIDKIKEDEEELNIIPFWEVTQDYIQYRRSLDIDKICKYWVKILDDFLWWILPSELVVVAAETGLGKSEIAYTSAIYNAIRWKRVLLLALEWDISEISARLLHQNINAKLDDDKKLGVPAYRFNLNKNIYGIEDDVFNELWESLKKNLSLYDKKQIPSIWAIKKLIEREHQNFDLIIIDHLHYIYLGDINQESAALGWVMRELKTITDIYKKPILLMSHLRKKIAAQSKKEEPNINDLYWSSNIAKESTTILFILKDNIESHDFWKELNETFSYKENRLSLTKIKLLKSRAWLPVPTSFHLIYDMLNKKYLDEFQQIYTRESSMQESDSISKMRHEIENFDLDEE